MSTRLFGLIELFMIFGGVIAFGVYQMWSVRRAIRIREERDAAAALGKPAVTRDEADGSHGRPTGHGHPAIHDRPTGHDHPAGDDRSTGHDNPAGHDHPVEPERASGRRGIL